MPLREVSLPDGYRGLGVRRVVQVTVTPQSDYGKPEPALVIRPDFFEAHPSVTPWPVTSELRETPLFRVGIKPGTESGRRKTFQAVVDKVVTVAREKVGAALGALDAATIEEVERRLSVFRASILPGAGL